MLRRPTISDRRLLLWREGGIRQAVLRGVESWLRGPKRRPAMDLLPEFPRPWTMPWKAMLSFRGRRAGVLCPELARCRSRFRSAPASPASQDLVRSAFPRIPDYARILELGAQLGMSQEEASENNLRR